MEIYGLLIPFDQRHTDKSDIITEILARNVKPSEVLTEKHFVRYSIETLIANGSKEGYERKWDDTLSPKDPSTRYRIYLDTSIAFGLMYDNEPVAVIGFTWTDTTTLLVKQLQGVRPVIDEIKVGNTWGIAQLYWKHVLVEYLMHYAKETDMKKIIIQGAKNNKWLDRTDIKKLKRIYDWTAASLNFQQMKDKNWYKRVK